MKRRLLILIVAVAALLALSAGVANAATLTDVEALGKSLFFDTNLSLNANQSCATCHGPEAGYTGPDSAINAAGAVYEGSVPGAFGNRKPPAAAYAGGSPVLYYDAMDGVWVGGMFWDGRATGWRLGDPLAEQALGPFLNPLEQALPSPADVIALVHASSYAADFEAYCGMGPAIWDLANTAFAYDCVGRAIAAYERSLEVSPYSSKYDAYLAGEAKLAGKEKLGMDVFFGDAKCSLCHNGPDFTDFTYDNLGLPKNLANPFYTSSWNPDGFAWIDPGLGGFLKSAGYGEDVWQAAWGKHKVPTLRNVDLRPQRKKGAFVKAYGHNGYFKSLKEIVHFYNTRDVSGAKWKGMPWPPAEVSENVNTDELGDLGLTGGEEDAIVKFLQTLNDGYINVLCGDERVGEYEPGEQ